MANRSFEPRDGSFTVLVHCRSWEMGKAAKPLVAGCQRYIAFRWGRRTQVATRKWHSLQSHGPHQEKGGGVERAETFHSETPPLNQSHRNYTVPRTRTAHTGPQCRRRERRGRGSQCPRPRGARGTGGRSSGLGGDAPASRSSTLPKDAAKLAPPLPHLFFGEISV